ncbi:MAG: DUF401 family protein [Pyramidobacter sp.]
MTGVAREFLAMAVAFGFLIFVPQRKIWKGFILILTGLIMGAGAGLAPEKLWGNFTAVVLTPSTMKTIAVIMQIGIFSALMKHYDILSSIYRGLKHIFPSARAVMMLLPAAIGMVSVPGGAAISSPFVDEIGASLHLPSGKRAAVNLTFRHIAYFLLPTSSSMILLSDLASGMNLYHLIALNIPFVFFMEATAYGLYLHGSETLHDAAPRNLLRGAVDILKYFSPIYAIVVLNAFFGIEMYISVFLSLLLILVCWGRRDPKTYWKVFWDGFNVETFVLMAGIYYLQNTVNSLPAVMGAFQALFRGASGFSVLLVIAASALFFGLTSGLSFVSLGILVPLLLGLGLPKGLEMLYCVFIYTWSFIGYFFSPLHLCLVLTVRQMGCSMKELYRSYLPLMAEMAVSPFLVFYLCRAFLP